MKKGRIYMVHYGKNIEVSRQFITSVAPFLNENLELVIINNSIEINLNSLKDHFISILDSEKNLGYFGALKYGMDHYPTDDLDYIVVSNNDIQIQSPDFFTILEEKLNWYDIITPSTKTLDNVEQNPHREKRPSTFRKYYYRIYFLNYIFAWLFEKTITFKKKSTKNIRMNQNEREIFSPHGGFIIFNCSYFQKGGYIDDGCFLFGEEDSIAAISNQYKLKIGFVPTLSVIHLESMSTGKGISRKKYEYKKSAYQYIKEKYPLIYKI